MCVRWYNTIVIVGVTIICLPTSCCVAGQGAAVDGKVLGGPCEYQTYRGKAKIVSINAVQKHLGKNTTAHRRQEVRFVFLPDEEIGQSWVQVEGKAFIMYLTNGRLPDGHFLQKYGIEINRFFECRLKVISKGSCTPIIFDFPAVDLSDYSTD